MNILTSDNTTISPYIRQIRAPQSLSHKGQNGKVLVIGGSTLFHGAVLWAAEAASHIVDMVHVASTEENNEIIRTIKTMWQTGMVVPQKDIFQYAKEDDVVLVGNGMMRITEEGIFTRKIVEDLIVQFPDTQFVFDAGAIQTMDREWLKLLKTRAIITPHQKEFQTLFDIDLHNLLIEEKEEIVSQKAKEYNCIILLKAVEDIVSNGIQTVRITGGNAGLTKGGTGDILAGIVAGLCATSDPFSSAVVASFLLKKTAEDLFTIKGHWYTAKDILAQFPAIFHLLTRGL